MNKTCKHFIIKSLLLVFVVLAGTSCASDKKEVTKIAESYLKAIVNYDFENARKFGDESAVQFLDQMQEYANSLTPAELEQARNEKKGIDIKITDVKITKEKAEVKYQFLNKEEVLHSETLYLTKKSGEWKVMEFM